MKITSSIIFQQLPAAFAPKKNKEKFTDNGLRAPLLYSGEFMYPDYVYIANASDISESELMNCTIISIGSPDFDTEKAKADIIIVDENISREILFNHVQMLFHDFEYWNSELTNITYQDMNIDKMFQIGRQHLPFSLLLMDKRFDPICISPELGTDNILTKNNASMLNTLLADSDLSETTEKNEVCIFYNPNLRKVGMYFNIFYNSDYRAKLIAITDYPYEITTADTQIFKLFAKHFEILYQRYAISPMRTHSYESLQGVIRSFIKGDEPNKSRVQSALEGAEWREDDMYAAYYIPYEENANIAIKAAYILTLLENKWNNVVTGSTRGVVMKNCMIWIVNCSKPAKVTAFEFFPEFDEFLREFDAKAGSSNVFNNFYELGDYVYQARLAYEYGKLHEPDKIHYPFSDYSLHYILDKSTERFKVKDIVHPAILMLDAYDKKENTEFCKTLRLFFHNKYNATQTSDALYIHRSTFAARIKRIEEICKIDLDDENTRLHILLSFYLLEKDGTLSPPSII
ncbi:MAG: helix-turn-helix domain-containing protein [Eubacteriaceae bacterium]|nr:helix-turn-helix domain-containing protein [Eubacteriaceae bacterium]